MRDPVTQLAVGLIGGQRRDLIDDDQDQRVLRGGLGQAGDAGQPAGAVSHDLDGFLERSAIASNSPPQNCANSDAG